MSPDDRDTIPAPGPGIDPDLVEAFASDLETLADNAESTTQAIRGLVASMRRETARAKAGA